MDFKSSHRREERAQECARILSKFPGRVPVIVERAARKADTVPLIDKNKFLVPGDLTLGQFSYVLRKRMTLSSDKCLFVFVGDRLPTTGSLMRELYGQYRDPEDGFLYITYCGEATFGEANRWITKKWIFCFLVVVLFLILVIFYSR